MPDAPAMRPYVGWAGDRSSGTVLVFARESRAAKPVVYGLLMSRAHVEYADVRVGRCPPHQVARLMQYVRPRMAAAGLAHGSDLVPTCSQCQDWASPIAAGGICSACSAAAQEAA